ncbi:MAG: serine hydrolase [Cyclobacteriaceae bacterium]
MKHYSITLIILLLSFVTFQCQNSPEKTDKEGLPAEVVATIEKRIEEGVTPSMALAIIDSSGVQYFNFGKTTANGKEVDEYTIYEIGSISKVFTAILLAQQVLDGDIQLEDKVNDFLPNDITIPVMGDTAITFGHLTDHTSGLPRMPGNFTPANPNNPYADYTVEQMHEAISSYQPVRAVGAEYEYSNLAQGLLGHLLAMNKNTTYEELMVQTIADPLEMNDTRIEFTERMKANLALGHSDGKVAENWDIPSLAGAGAIRSSTSDMARFIAAQLGDIDTPLSAAMELTHKVRHDKAGAMSVAMAWHIKKGEQGDVIWHNGGTGGYRTFAGFVKETGKGVVLLTNSSAGADDIGFYLLDPGSKLAEPKFKSDAVEIPASTLAQYVGVYELSPDFKITITQEGNQLFAQATGQERFGIYPENDTTFFLTVVEAKIVFQLDDNTVESLTLFQGGQEKLGRKIE